VSESFDLMAVDNFVAGTVGEPGERIFYLQAKHDTTVVSLKLEKGQVQALASGMADVLVDRDGAERDGAERDGAERDADEPVRPSEMTEPVVAAWTVGMLGIGIDEDNNRLVVLANEVEEDDESDANTARFHLTFPQARGFVEHALFLVEYGRDFGRQNGHRPL